MHLFTTVNMIHQKEEILEWTQTFEHHCIADTLSRTYLSDVSESEIPEEEYQVHCVVSNLQISSAKFQEFKQETSKDPVLQEVINLIKKGWPSSFSECSSETKPY